MSERLNISNIGHNVRLFFSIGAPLCACEIVESYDDAVTVARLMGPTAEVKVVIVPDAWEDDGIWYYRDVCEFIEVAKIEV